jgi:hypothetical protein
MKYKLALAKKLFFLAKAIKPCKFIPPTKVGGN